MKPYEAFYETGSKQKNKDLAPAINQAKEYMNEVIKENLCGWQQYNPGLSRNISEPPAETRKEDRADDNTNPFTVIGDRNQYKLKPSNLNKRKPIIKQRQILLQPSLKKPMKEIEKIELSKNNSDNKEEILKQPSRKSSNLLLLKPQESQPISLGDFDLDSAKLSDSIKMADRLAENLSLVRDNPDRFSKTDIQTLLDKICQFCAYCHKRSDEDLKQLVQIRLGSYLNVLIHLMIELNDCSGLPTSHATAALKNLIAMVKQKTLNYVRSV